MLTPPLPFSPLAKPSGSERAGTWEVAGGGQHPGKVRQGIEGQQMDLEQMLDIRHLPLGLSWFELLTGEFLMVSIPDSFVLVGVLGLEKALKVTVR